MTRPLLYRLALILACAAGLAACANDGMTRPDSSVASGKARLERADRNPIDSGSGATSPLDEEEQSTNKKGKKNGSKSRVNSPNQ